MDACSILWSATDSWFGSKLNHVLNNKQNGKTKLTTCKCIFSPRVKIRFNWAIKKIKMEDIVNFWSCAGNECSWVRGTHHRMHYHSQRTGQWVVMMVTCSIWLESSMKTIQATHIQHKRSHIHIPQVSAVIFSFHGRQNYITLPVPWHLACRCTFTMKSLLTELYHGPSVQIKISTPSSWCGRERLGLNMLEYSFKSGQAWFWIPRFGWTMARLKRQPAYLHIFHPPHISSVRSVEVILKTGQGIRNGIKERERASPDTSSKTLHMAVVIRFSWELLVELD